MKRLAVTAALLLSRAGAVTVPHPMGQTKIKRTPKCTVVPNFGFIPSAVTLGLEEAA